MCMAAVHNGADAIYVGAPNFNARGRSKDFGLDELKEIIDFCHLYGVRVNLAFNVVIFENELQDVHKQLSSLIALAPDAFIVQDLGLAYMLRSMAPHQRIHASTQMTITNVDAINFVSDLNIDRFVLGRENSIKEIKMIREHTPKELEVFVHGALCVAYSGQCFTSESIGGRSANRGQCAQSCRLEYELFVDGEKKEMGDRKYLVSPKDLMGLEHTHLLKEIGVDSFKIEGRLKSPEYVASSARNYRQVLDGQPLEMERRSQELSLTYSRGFFSGWLEGVNHQKLVDGNYSAHRGQFIGEIKEVLKNRIQLTSSSELSAGMGLLFVSKQEQGSKIFQVKKINSLFEVELLSKNLKLEKGMKVYLNSHDAQDVELKKSFENKNSFKKIPIKFLVQGLANEPLLVKATDPEGREVYAQTVSLLIPSTGRGMTSEDVTEELTALGGSVYKSESLEIFLSDGLFIHQRELKTLRREIIEKLNTTRTQRGVPQVVPFTFTNPIKTLERPRFNVLLRTLDQVNSMVDYLAQHSEAKNDVKMIILDFEFGKDFLPSVELVKKHGIQVAIATTRILKPSEYYNLNMIIRSKPDYVLVRNLGAFEYLKNHSTLKLIGDFSLNVTNSLSVHYLIQKGLETINLSYDLNQVQLFDLIQACDPSKLEVTVHQYMPEFHMEHCVFAAFLSQGTSFKDCGKPCEKHQVKLKDPYQQEHFLKADHECRNTFFKATPQSAGFLIGKIKESGLNSLRLEALEEKGEEWIKKFEVYRSLLNEKITSEDAQQILNTTNTYGVTSGQLAKGDGYRDRKKT